MRCVALQTVPAVRPSAKSFVKPKSHKLTAYPMLVGRARGAALSALNVKTISFARASSTTACASPASAHCPEQSARDFDHSFDILIAALPPMSPAWERGRLRLLRSSASARRTRKLSRSTRRPLSGARQMPMDPLRTGLAAHARRVDVFQALPTYARHRPVATRSVARVGWRASRPYSSTCAAAASGALSELGGSVSSARCCSSMKHLQRIADVHGI
jgi:hypothetical protein